MQKKRKEAECKKKEQKQKCKKEKWRNDIYERRERMKKNMPNTDIKEKDSLYTAESIKIN